MIMGVPVISNAPADLFGDISLIDMKNYVYTNTNDLNSVVNKVKKVLNDKNLREKIGKGGRKFITNNLNWNYVIEKIEKVMSIKI